MTQPNTITIAEQYVQCDDALGCWVFAGAWRDLQPSEVKQIVTKHLLKGVIEEWRFFPNRGGHPDSFFINRARVAFERDWRVRTVPLDQVVEYKDGGEL
jgi:hypothetical protein